MPQLDLINGFLNIENKLKATKAFNDLNTQYKKAKKQAGSSFEQKKSDTTKTLNSIKDKTKGYQKQIKTQFEQLLV